MPWAPELFSAPVLQGVLDKYRRGHMRSVPFFDGLLSGEVDALVESFSGVPEVHHPVRGRIKGEGAFRRFVTDMTSWLAAGNAEIEHVNWIITDRAGSKRSSCTSTATADASPCRWRSAPTTTRTSASSSCACTSAAGR
jgi:hypothetical protein